MDETALEILGLGLSWEQLPVGRKFRTVGRTITEADLVNFIGATGMLEVLFTTVGHDSGAAIQSRLVPAALVYSFAEGLLIQSSVQGVGLAFLNMQLDVKGPTFVGLKRHLHLTTTMMHYSLIKDVVNMEIKIQAVNLFCSIFKEDIFFHFLR